MKRWQDMNKSGVTFLSRLSAEYEVVARHVPLGGRFRIKVYERSDGSFFAIPNVCLKAADGSPDMLSATGRSEVEAVEELLAWFMKELNKRESYEDDDFEWTDPVAF